MGNRLSKIYTRTGDDGSTGLGDGTRVDKDSLRIEAMGTVDELNCSIGSLLCHSLPQETRSELINIQHSLFDIGGELCIPGSTVITPDRVDRLEHLLDTLNEQLAPLKEFILPGGSPAAAVCHQARAVCRRAERRTHSLAKIEEINSVSLKYLNRLSDLLFVMARHINKTAGIADVLWEHQHSN